MTRPRPAPTRAGLALLAALLLALPALAANAWAAAPAGFAELAAKIAPAVINIRAEREPKPPAMGPAPGHDRRGPGREGPPELHEFFRRFFGGEGLPTPPQQRRALGSGVIVDPEGLALTNHHVVEGADKIVVKLNDGQEIEAQVVGSDPKTDLALIRLKQNGPYPALALGDSDQLRVGDWVLAAGNPFGLENTVTAGIVSAKGRIIGAGPYDDFIQTDASINPGNSGGALVDMQGRLVGIPTAIAAQGQGIGFAIPANLAKSVMAQLKDKGRVVRGWLGVYTQPVDADLAAKFGLKDNHGALLADVAPDGPAMQAGLKRGDVVTSFDGKPVDGPAALARLVAGSPVGHEARLGLVRAGKTLEIKVKLGELQDAPTGGRPAGGQAREGLEKLGLAVQPLDPELAQRLGAAAEHGLAVVSVAPGGPAAAAGLKRGDVILEAGQAPVKDAGALEQAWSQAQDGLLLLVQRQGHSFFAVLKKN
ncbi:MAG: Do family serine endopeptidase [Thermodesulfobacteriota bacterium]